MKYLLSLMIALLISVSSFAQGRALEENLSLAVEKAMEVAQKTGEFVIEQAPLLLQEFYTWHIAKAVLGVIFGILIYIVGTIIIPFILRSRTPKVYECYKGKFEPLTYFKWKYNVIDSDGVSVGLAFSWVASTIGAIAGIAVASMNLYKLVFILTAPKLYLIEYFIR